MNLLLDALHRIALEEVASEVLSELVQSGWRSARALPAVQGRCAVMTPGRRPLAALDVCLAAVTAEATDAPEDQEQPSLLLVVDQFEELFTDCADPAERQAFVARLTTLANAGPTTDRDPTVVVLGLRADFYRQVTAFEALRPVLEHAQVVLGAMAADQVHRAIVEPALRAKLDLEEGLVDVVMADLPPEAGAPPLLSHVLLTMWQAAGRSRLTVADYRATGGLRAAVAGTAEQAFAELDADQREAARLLFLRLVAIGDDTADTRRRVDLDELFGGGGSDDAAHARGNDVAAVLAVFVARRMITMDADSVEITHEALLDAWPRLRGWVDADRAGLRVRRQVTEAARSWEELGRDPSSLFRGARLDAAQQWLEGRDAARELTGQERAFLRTSTERETAERLRRAAPDPPAAPGGGDAGVAARGLGRAGRLVGPGDRHGVPRRDLALSRQVAAASDRLRATDTSLAAQLAAVAYRQARTAEARSAVLDTSATATARRFTGPRGVLQAVSVSADQRVLAGGSESGLIRVWSPGRARRRRRRAPRRGHGLRDHPHPDGRTLIAGGAGGVSLWDLRDARRPAPLPALPQRPTSTVFSLAFAPGGHVLAAAGVDGVLRLWDVTDPRAPQQLGAPSMVAESYVFGLAYSPDGRLLAATSADRSVWVLDVATPDHISVRARLTDAPNDQYGVAFSPDGRTRPPTTPSGE